MLGEQVDPGGAGEYILERIEQTSVCERGYPHI